MEDLWEYPRLLLRALGNSKNGRRVYGGMIIGIRCIEYYVHPRIISIETSVCGPFVRKAASAKESDRMQERDADIGKRFRLHRPRGIDDRQRAVMNYSHRNVELIAYNATVYVMRFREFVDIYAKTIYHLISKANCNAEICI